MKTNYYSISHTDHMFDADKASFAASLSTALQKALKTQFPTRNEAEAAYKALGLKPPFYVAKNIKPLLTQAGW